MNIRKYERYEYTNGYENLQTQGGYCMLILSDKSARVWFSGRMVAPVIRRGKLPKQQTRGFVSSDDTTLSNDRAIPNMYYVYILQLENKTLYTGSTGDLKRRIAEHKRGKVLSTKNKLPVTLILYEAYILESDACRRERYLKTTEGKRFLKQQIRDYLLSAGLV